MRGIEAPHAGKDLALNIISDEIDFEAYFSEHQDEGANVKAASSWAEDVIDRLYGETSRAAWTPTCFDKCRDRFEIRPGEVTLWAGINGHGKTTMLSQVMLGLMQEGEKVCIASMEMKPADTMLKMTRQAAGVSGTPSIDFVRRFHKWTDNRLWIYDHLGKLPTKRALAVAMYVRKETGVGHLVIDSMMKCGIGPEDYAGQKDFVDELCTIARDTGLHIHLVVHMRKGENEFKAPDKFGVKGASEVTDLVDNLIIVWKNLNKKEDETTKPDSYMRVAKQRHFSWEGSFAFWFDRESQQYMEHEHARPRHITLTDEREAA